MEANTVLAKNSNQLVSFNLAEEEYSFPINVVQEIVRLPKITPIPRAPESVKGIMNLRGSILPLIDLRKRFHLEDVEYGENTRVVVVRHQGNHTGMIVDKVNEVLHVENDQIESPPADLEASRTSGLRGIAKFDDGKRIVMILSGEKILSGAETTQTTHPLNHTATTSVVSQKAELKNEAERLLIIFRLCNEEFAVNIMEVREIVRVGEIVSVPRVPDFVLGVMTLRNSLLPVIDLRLRLGIEVSDDQLVTAGDLQNDEADARRIIVADLGGVTTGLMVDSVSEVLRLPEKDVEPTPSSLDPDSAKFIQGIGKMDDGNRLLMLLDLPRLLSAHEKDTISTATGDYDRKGEKTMDEKKDSVDERQVVCFRIEDEEYGIEIMQVREIIRLDTITEVPGAPAYVSGIVNLRGDVLPVIDLRKRFRRNIGQSSEQNRILVVDIGDKKTGIIVDAVSEVLHIPENCIEPAPQILRAHASTQYVSGICKINEGKRTIILVNTDILLEQEEIDALPNRDNNSHDSKSEIAESDSVVEPSDERVNEEKAVEELMALKKEELLAKARQFNIVANKNMTKKEIARLIVEAGFVEEI